MNPNESVDPETGEVTMAEAEPVVTAILTRDEAQERALLDVQVSTAKRYPRSLPAVRNRILSLATVDEETAVACFYGLKPGPDGREFTRGGKRIVGESVRLAEIVASSYGNMRVQSEVVRVGDDTVTCRARCWDLEANYAVESEVVRRILAGRSSGDDWKDRQKREDAVALASMSGQAIARRTAIFNVVPPATLRSVFGKVKEAALGKAATLAERRGKAVEHLGKMGVSLGAVLYALGKPSNAKVEDIDLEDLLVVRGWVEAIREGTATVAELFQAPAGEAAAQGAAESVEKGRSKGRKATAPAAPETKPAEPPKPETPKAEESKPQASSGAIPEGAV